MAYQMAATAVTLKVIHMLQAFSNAIRRICAAFYTTSTDSVLARSLCVSWASCYLLPMQITLRHIHRNSVAVCRRHLFCRHRCRRIFWQSWRGSVT